MDNYLNSGKIIDFTNNTGSPLVSGQPVLMGRQLGICATDIATSAIGAVYRQGYYSGVTKVTTDVVALFDILYWDNSAKKLTTSGIGNPPVAMAMSAANGSATTVDILLLPAQADPNAAAAAIPIIAAAGTADAITAAYSPAIALADKTIVCVVAGAANATTAPTFAPNGLTAHPITKHGGQPLALGDIPGALAVLILEYSLANTRWELLNPATVAGTGFLAIDAVIATNINLATNNLTAIGGYTPGEGDLVAVTGQTTTTQNGLYVAHAAGGWLRLGGWSTGDRIGGRLLMTPDMIKFMVYEGISYDGGTSGTIVGTDKICIGPLEAAAGYFVIGKMATHTGAAWSQDIAPDLLIGDAIDIIDATDANRTRVAVIADATLPALGITPAAGDSIVHLKAIN